LARRSELATDIAARLQCPPALELRGDADLLEIALANLLENALKYGTGTIELGCDTALQWQRLELRNHLPPVGTASGNAADAGHGLGIRICETVAALHQGRFSFSLEPTKAVAVLEWPL